jgi:THO complex subunit 1
MFLFQGFPLGARSSVNPKGEFHKENITAYEGMPSVESQDGSQTTSQKTNSEGSTEHPKVDPTSSAEVKDKSEVQAVPLSEDDLYPIFWMMQEAFSNPPDYFFKNKRTEEFKRALEATLAKFIAVPKVNQAAVSETRSGSKRAASEMESQDEIANTFNPKYLTSRELFTLEVCTIFCVVVAPSS